MITVDYDLKNHTAKIACTDQTIEYQWNKVRRLVEDNAEISNIVNLKEINLPWWCFLSIRSELEKTLRINNLDIEVTDTIKTFLERAQVHENEYIKKRKEYSDEKIIKELLSKGFTRKLTEHQLRNLKTLLNYPAAATFSVPGAGKTTEALAYFALKKEEKDRLLVVSPRNAFSAWEEELFNCMPKSNLKITRLQGTDDIRYALERTFDISLITYQQFYRVQDEIAQRLMQGDFFMFLDESHRIKRGYSGVYGSSILSVCHLAKYKLVMSGTPLPNSIDDLIPQFTFLYPEIPVSSDDVREKFQPLYVRTTKTELGIKPPIRKLWTFDMKPAQKTLYENIISETRRSLEGMRLDDRTLFNQISKSMVRLMQVNTDPSLLVNTELNGNELFLAAINEGPAIKIEEACHLARNLAQSGQKSIIWTQFVDSVENIADLLSDLNAQFIHGGVCTDEDEENYESRESIIKRFHSDSACFVLVANPAACSEGISLHKVCHHAIYVDRNYNAAHYLQSEDRIHRLGLDPNQDTFIHIFSCKGSIDEAIAQRLELKIQRMGQVLNDTGLSIEPIETIDESNGLTFEDVLAFKALIMGEGKDA
jgi:SNF2 family DNA or RNA helicase